MNIYRALAVPTLVVILSGASHEGMKPYAVEEVSLAQISADLASGKTSSVAVTQAYIHRIKTYDRVLHAVILIAPDALDQAAASDTRRADHRTLGPLDGVPILLKDNIDVVGVPTTAGFLFERDPLALRAVLAAAQRSALRRLRRLRKPLAHGALPRGGRIIHAAAPLLGVQRHDVGTHAAHPRRGIRRLGRFAALCGFLRLVDLLVAYRLWDRFRAARWQRLVRLGLAPVVVALV